MSDPVWDQQIWNNGQIAEKCMQLGAVVLKPKDKPPVGFSSAVEPPKTTTPNPGETES